METKQLGVNIYNLFPRLVGTMDNWITHFDRIKDLGFDWIYINPFHYPGFSGSLYAPKDYYEFNPMFVNFNSKLPPVKQLENMINEGHKRDLKLIMDLVINHTSKDNPFVRTHPDWYQKDENGNIKSPGAWDNGNYVEWGDLAEIDNAGSSDRENLWNYWKQLVIFYIERGFDGFRADAAYQVPSELWSLLIDTAKKKNNQIKFFAESLGCSPEQTLELANAGFDYIFNSSKWWNFEDDWLLKQYNLTREIAPSISFPESHDTLRLATELNGNINLIRQRIVFSAFFSSGWMIPIGMEYGFKKKIDVVKTTSQDWEQINYDLTDLIREINNVRKTYLIFNQECPIEIVDNDNRTNVIVLRKTSLNRKEKALIIINKDVNNTQKVFYGDFLQAIEGHPESKIIDLSFDHRMPEVPGKNFEYLLNPSEIKLFYTKIK